MTVHLDVESIRVECTENALPFGFAVSSRQGTTVLRLGKFRWARSRRSYYRLAHLDETTRQQIWHARGLVHALLTIYTEQTQVHLRPGFRQINGWDTQGTLNKNDDSWGYSRALGRESARLDFITFGEEWFVRPPDRKRKPDNRVECQSFQKGRVFQKLFEPEAVDLPPKYCESFWAWSRPLKFVDVLYTSPGNGAISSFGHLALLMSRSETTPEPLDPVYQFVGLVNLNSAKTESLDVVWRDVPFVLQAQPWATFERQNREYEDRSIRRFRLKLSSSQRIWLLAVIWDKFRRWQARYHFTKENCAHGVLETVAGLSEHEVLSQPGVTISPAGVLSALAHARYVDSRSVYFSSISERLIVLKNWLNRANKELKERGVLIPPPEPMSESLLTRWTLFLSRKTVGDDLVGDYLHHYLDFVELSSQRQKTSDARLVPVASNELLKLKHELYHEEKSAEEVASRLTQWYEQHLSETKFEREQDRIAHVLSEQIGRRLQELGVFDVKQMPGTIKPSQHSAKTTWPIWGADGMVEMGLGIFGRRSPSLNVSGALYEEQFGRERTLIMQSTRDLSIIKVGLQTFSDRRATLTLVPMSLHSRSDFMGIRQLGQRFHSDVVIGERRVNQSIAWGPSAQLLSWARGRGNMSLGGLLAGRWSWQDHLRFRLPVFLNVSLPLRSLFARVECQYGSFNGLGRVKGLYGTLEMPTALTDGYSTQAIIYGAWQAQNPRLPHTTIGIGVRLQ